MIVNRISSVKPRRGQANLRTGRRLLHEPLEPRHLLDAGPLWITEFMAANKGVLADDDNAYSDWIEIHNPTEAPVSLDGWYLTDDSDKLTKWRFPAVSIDAGGYLTVFASDKDRTDPAATLHTNFKLTSDGEYLALVRPDGVTISHDYDTFPPLADNVSFGLPGRADDLTYHVPTSADAGLGLGWTAGGYDDSAWSGASSSSVHITEIGTGTPDYIEIQNLAGTAVDTSGWTLAMKRSYSTPINDFGIVEVALPSVMYPGQILFRNNLANNWRFDLAHRDTQLDLATSWYAAMSGWALVLDDQGVVVDLVAWGYTEAELAMLDVTINGFQVTADTAWLGAPVPSSTSGTPILSRVGTSDHDDAGDFAWEAPSYAWWSSSSVTTGSIGAPNPNLAGAFATTDTSLGFTPYNAGMDTRIQTDLSVAMQDVNSSIWMRREFESDGGAGRTDLTLRIRYSDGFVAYLNGVEIARDNAPGSLAWDSAATAARTLAEAVDWVEIDVSAYLGSLHGGVNVLAVQGLNDSAAEANFLLDAELVDAGSLDANRYFLVPTPGSPNGRGSSATDKLPRFSQPTGAYYAPFDLTLTTAAPGAVIRYTLDESDPTEASPIYTAPITIDSSVRVRAAVFLPGRPTSLVASESYFVLDPALQSFDTNLGMMVIDTFGQSINQTDYATVATAFYETGLDGRASLGDAPDYTSLAGLKLRGTYSLWLNDTHTGLPGDVRMGEKPSYRLELRDELGDDLGASILGLPKESDWVLYSLYDDRTLMRDYLSYQWFNETGNWAPSGRYIELYVNEDGDEVTPDDYVGLYIVLQKIAIGDDLVDIAELDPEDAAEPRVTGGYLIAEDRIEPGDTFLTTNRGYRFIYTDPDTGDISAAQQAYFLGYMNEFESVLYGANFADPVDGYAKYIDVDSFIDMHIMQEVSKNWDGYKYSSFFYKDRGGKLAAGPLWDMNITFGASYYGWGTDWTNPSPEYWHYSLISSSEYATQYYPRLFQDPEFAQQYADRLNELLNTVFTEEKMMADMTALATYLDEAQQRHFQRWDNLMGEYVWPAAWWGETYEEEVDIMRNWIHARLMWIKSQFTTPPRFSEDESALEVKLSAPIGTIYYTTDGTDPRLTGGGISPNAAALDSVSADTRFIASGATWMYLDTGVDLDTAWRDLSFDRTAWSSGPSQLGYGDGDEATVVGYGPNAAAKYTTTYFAKQFEVTDASAFESVELRLLRDDAAVVYVNGQEVVRSNITYANVYYDTLATQDVSGTSESRFYEYDLDPSVLVDGTNIIAVEVHQSNPTSSDLSFDLELKGIGGVSGELAVDQGTQIIARTLSGTSWSGITEAVTTMDPQLSGDLNDDGQVNSDDLNIVRANWGQAVPIGDWTMGDPTGDGVVNSDDLDIVRANWGAGTPSPAAARTDSEDSTRASSPSFIGPRRESASDEALSSWSNSNSGHGLCDSDLASLAEAAWLREIEGLRSKGKRRGVEQGSLSEMVLMAE